MDSHRGGSRLSDVPLIAATSFARASTYVIISMAAQLSVLPVFGLIPVMWFGEAVRWVLRVADSKFKRPFGFMRQAT